jgi:hypothetical protein
VIQVDAVPGNLLGDPRWKGAGLVFLGGHPRSGTTFLGRLLGHHPGVAYWEEPGLLWRHKRFARHLEELGLEQLGHHLLVDARVAREGATILAAREGPPLKEQFGEQYVPGGERQNAALEVTRRILGGLVSEFRDIAGKPFVLDKTPADITHFRFGLRLLPDARFIHVVRDPRDVACSALSWFAQKGLRPPWLPVPTTVRRIPGGARLWARHGWRTEIVVNVARQWGDYVAEAIRLEAQAPPTRLYKLRYERLMEDPDGEISRLLRFLDLQWTPEIDEFLARGNSGGLDPSSVGRWRRDLSWIRRMLIERIAGSLMRDLGYLNARPSHSDVKTR